MFSHGLPISRKSELRRCLRFPPWLFRPQATSELCLEPADKCFISKRVARMSGRPNQAATLFRLPPTDAPTRPPSVRDRVLAATDSSRASRRRLGLPRAQARSTTDTPAHPRPVPLAPDLSPHRPVPSRDGPGSKRRRKTVLARDGRFVSIAD